MKNLNQLNRDVRKVTAFNSYLELLRSVLRDGYRPTIRPERERRDDRPAARRLRNQLITDRVNVYPSAGAYAADMKLESIDEYEIETPAFTD